jgi:hypothetical protein
MPKMVKLVYGTKKEILCESILSSATKITGKIKIGKDDPDDADWALVVVNEDGGECRRENAFKVEK